jgi:hypothetical protein
MVPLQAFRIPSYSLPKNAIPFYSGQNQTSKSNSDPENENKTVCKAIVLNRKNSIIFSVGK